MRVDVVVASACRADLDALPSFLIENDAGAPEHLTRNGAAVLDAALLAAREAAAQVTTGDEAVHVLRRYLAAWRPGHLNVGPVALSAPPQVAAHQAPKLEVLSPSSLLWTLPSFDPRHRSQLAQLIHDQRETLEAHRRWIIDLRGNGGGSDDTYAPLLPWLMGNAWQGVGVEFLATPANVAAHRNVLEQLGVDDPHSRALIDELVRALGAVPPGQWARVESEREGIVRHAPETVTFQRPESVAVLIDRGCGSSAEQFLLDLRQSLRVKLLGRPTAGVLDYSNVRPHRLPSGQHVLWYATSRSLRLPHFPLDGIGIAPDVFLPLPTDAAGFAAEILAAQRFLDSAV